MPHAEHETFDRAVDEFFSTLEGQKIDMKVSDINYLETIKNNMDFALKLFASSPPITLKIPFPTKITRLISKQK